MKEIKRVLKSGGKLILTTPNKWIYRFFMYLSNLKNWIKSTLSAQFNLVQQIYLHPMLHG